MLRRSQSSVHLTGYAAVGVSISALILLRQFPTFTFATYQLVMASDLGNAVAALVAVAGYMIEHYSSRKALQREAQMARVTAQSQQFLVPLSLQFHSLFLGSTLQFVDKHMGIFGSALSGGYGVISSEVLKKYIESPVSEIPTELANPSSIAYLTNDVMFREQKGQMGKDQLGKDQLGKGLSAFIGRVPKTTNPTELPEFLHRTLEQCKRPNSKLWRSYEAYVRNELFPAVSRIAEIIDENGHLMQPVPPKRLQEMFGRTGNGFGQKWEIAPRMWFYSLWLAYARSWTSVLALWDIGVYDQIRPSMPFPIGMLIFNIEAQTIVAGLEKQLVGMSQMHGNDPNT